MAVRLRARQLGDARRDSALGSHRMTEGTGTEMRTADAGRGGGTGDRGTPDAEGSRGDLRHRMREMQLAQRLALPCVWLLVIAVFGALRPSSFLTLSDFSAIFGSQAVLAVLALSLVLPLTAGDYDLSIAATLTLSAMLIAVLNVNHHWPITAAVAMALAVGCAVGLINGFLIIVLDVESLIATLGTGTVLQGIVLWISGSNTISGISSSLVNATILTKVFGIPIEFYYALVLCAAMWYFLEYTAVGRRLLFVGRGRDVSRLSGVRVNRLRWGALLASSVIAAFAGVLYVGNGGGADPTSGLELLLPAFAAAFLGQTTIMPGRFNAWGTFVATYFLITGITGLQIIGVASFVQDLFYGGALIVAVALAQSARRRREKARVRSRRI